MTFNMHQEAITSKAKKLIKPLSSLDNFYLADDTGLALQIGHRQSIDFDFFTPETLKGTLGKIETMFSPEISVNQHDQLTVMINSVQVSFISYPYPIFGQFNNWQGLKILTPKTIAVMKAYALGRRATFKDYVDLYYIINLNICPLNEIINSAGKIFGTKFNDRLFLEQLVFLEDVKQENIKFLDQPVTKKKIKEFFEKEIKNYELH